jgi:hypothetical protein
MSEPAAPEIVQTATPETHDDRRTWVLVIGVGVIGGVILGVILTTLDNRKARLAAPTPSLDGIDEQAPWAVSLQHLAGAWDLRFSAIEDRLRVLDRDAGLDGPGLPEPVIGGDVAPGPPPEPAAVSVPEGSVYEDVSE